jgi:hypothetical protein
MERDLALYEMLEEAITGAQDDQQMLFDNEEAELHRLAEFLREKNIKTVGDLIVAVATTPVGPGTRS